MVTRSVGISSPLVERGLEAQSGCDVLVTIKFSLVVAGDAVQGGEAGRRGDSVGGGAVSDSRAIRRCAGW